MATKYFCDGCDKEVPFDIVEKLSVSIQNTAFGGTYELCKRCADTLRRDSNPKNWTRCGPPTKGAEDWSLVGKRGVHETLA